LSTTVNASQQEDLPKTSYAAESFWLIAAVIVIGNVAGTLGAADQLCKIPLQNILKGSLHVQRHDMAQFFFVSGLFFYLKPIVGILTDAFPILGTRRRYYLLYSSALAAVAWVVLGLVKESYSSLLSAVIAVDLFIVMISTVAGAFLVEVGQSRGEVGKLTAVRSFARVLCFTVQGPLGGLLAGTFFWVATGTGAVVALSILPIAYFFVKEKPVQRNLDALQNAGREIVTIGRSWPFWMATLFIALFKFAPGLGSTMLYYRQTDVLHMSQQNIGYLGAVGSVAGLLAAAVYFQFARRIPIRTALIIGVVLSAAAALLYIFYTSQPLAFAIDGQNGLFQFYIEVALLDLAGRATPAGCEGLAYAFMMSIANLSGQGSDWLAASLADKYHLSWNSMVYMNAGTTLFVLVLIPLMPRVLMASRDNASPNLENTGEPTEVPDAAA